MPQRSWIRVLLVCAALGFSGSSDRAAFGQRRGSRSSSVRSVSRSASVSRSTTSRTSATRATTYSVGRTTISGYGSIRHGGVYGGSAQGGAVRTPYGGAAHIEGARGREATAVRTPWGSRATVEGYGREVTASRGPLGGGIHVDGRFGREATAVWGPNRAVAAARGPYGGAVAVADNYYRGGTYVRRPVGHSTVVIGGSTYYGWGGRCYSRVYYNGEVTYVGVRPPIGWSVVVLPDYCETVVIQNNTYYVREDVYYASSTKDGVTSYVVVDPQVTQPAAPVGQDPFVILRKMSDYLANCQSFSLSTSDTMDDTLPTGQKIQVGTRRTIRVQRPDRFQVEVTGDVADREIVYDGRTVSWHDRRKQAYGTVDAPENIDEVLDFMADRYGVTVPLADLFYSDAYGALLPAAQTGRLLGTSSVEGMECHHLAFEGKAIDWQIWIQTGDQPLPRKIVITYKTSEGAPRYRCTIDNWDLSPTFSASLFEFRAPQGTTRLDVLPVTGG